LTRIESERAVLAGRPLFLVLLAGATLVVVLLMALQREDRPNILVITIDTLRADALTKGDMPALTALAARGVRFERARTPVPLTLPAHVSLLAGVDARQHGMRANTAVPLPGRDDRDFTLLAEELQDAGYSTAAFVASSVLHPRFGAHAGFDTYRHPELQRAGAPAFETRDAVKQVELASKWLASRPKGQPYFLWVHLWEPHAPYREYAGDERRPGTSAESDDARELYRGEVRKADWAVERILALVDEATTVVLVTSDHGESLGEHGEATHGHLCYGATMDVPLVLAGPGVPEGKAERAICDLTDVKATLLGLCGLDVAGPTLLDLPRDRVVVGESLYAYGLYRWAQQVVAYDGTHSLVDGGPVVQLFDREADPHETAPLSDPTSAVLDKAITDYKSGEDAPRGGAAWTVAGTPYGALAIPATFVKPAENRALPAVGPWIMATELAINPLNAAIAAGRKDRVEALLTVVVSLERRDPNNPALALARGRGLLLLERADEALKALEQAVERGYPRRDLEGLLRRAGAGR
jgi:arylsulfatase A-like enzyme